MPQQPPFVFLSYAHADKEFATRLKTDLCEQGIVVWIDKEGIEAGTHEWEETIRDAIRDAFVVLLVASPHARHSSYVKAELRLADMYQRPVYPIWAQGTQWMDCVPLLSLSGAQYIDAREIKYETAFHELVKVLRKVLSEVPSPPRADLDFEPRNPYKGLRAFGTKDARDFFGREALTSELIEKLQEALTPTRSQDIPSSFLAVVGPSGSGKSSVVMAGLLPRLQRGALAGSETWVHLKPITPGAHPLTALMGILASVLPEEQSMKALRDDLADEQAQALYWYAAKLVPSSEGKVLLIVDQFEELFTQTTDEKERKHFIDLLVTATTEPHSPLLVIATLRADFFDRPMQYPDLYRLIDAHHCSILAMDYHDLREVITRPAAQPDVQLTFEDDLVGDLLFEMQGQIGALPLLEFTLEQLFQRRRGHLLTLQAYRGMAGVKGALTQHAEQVYAALPTEEHRKLARALFVRLIALGATEQDTTRRRAALSEFSLDDPIQTHLMQETIDTFIAARLLTANEVGAISTIEVSHEAVLREWPRLAEWVRGAREDIALQQTISNDATEWEHRGRPKDRLYRGSQLNDANKWAKLNLPSRNEVVFLQTSTTYRKQYFVRLIAGSIAIVLLLTLTTGLAVFLPRQTVTKIKPIDVTRVVDVTKIVNATNFTHVITLDDDGPGSLRGAIASASDGNTITFDASLKGTIKLASTLRITKRITLRGPGADSLAIGQNDVIVAASGVSISGLAFGSVSNTGTLTMTNCIISAGKVNGTSTGGLTNSGTLTFINSSVRDSAHYSGTGLGPNASGGILNTGTLTLINSIVSGNNSNSSGGGIYNDTADTLTLINSTVSSNSAYDGGGISNDGGKVTLINSTVSGNSAGNNGGGIENVSTFHGIRIENESKVTLINSTISGNSASHGGGGIENYTGTVTLINSTISGNSVAKNDGGVFHLNGGGGILNVDGPLTVTNSTVSGNSAGDNGGGIFDEYGKADITFCTIYSNTAYNGGGVFIPNNRLDQTPPSYVVIRNSIIADNNAQIGRDISGTLTTMATT